MVHEIKFYGSYSNHIQAMETGNPTTILVRDWDCQNFREISMAEYRAAEDAAGKTSAFAETRAVVCNETVGNGLGKHEFLEYRNS